MPLAGFTLIEIIIALAVVAILSALAYPSYVGAVRKGRRLDAMSALTKIQMAQEQYRATHPRYAGNLLQLGWSAERPFSVQGYYRLQLQEQDNPALSFVAWAVPTASGGQNHDICQRFVLDQDGPDWQHTLVPGCWQR